jgi:hypothetical protein
MAKIRNIDIEIKFNAFVVFWIGYFSLLITMVLHTMK